MTHTEALRLIADTDPIDAILDPQRLREIARAALAAPSVPSGEPQPVAWLVHGGRAFVDRAYTDRAHAEKAIADRKDGAQLSPLYAAPQPAQAGWRLVPVEPTKEMQWAGCLGLDHASSRDLDATLDEMAAAYRAMLAAAPAAPGA